MRSLPGNLIVKECSMEPSRRPPPDYNHYGLKDKSAKAVDVYANRPGGEEPGVGPMDAVDTSGHRKGQLTGHTEPQPSSRLGREAAGELDHKP